MRNLSMKKFGTPIAAGPGRASEVDGFDSVGTPWSLRRTLRSLVAPPRALARARGLRAAGRVLRGRRLAGEGGADAGARRLVALSGDLRAGDEAAAVGPAQRAGAAGRPCGRRWACGCAGEAAERLGVGRRLRRRRARGAGCGLAAGAAGAVAAGGRGGGGGGGRGDRRGRCRGGGGRAGGGRRRARSRPASARWRPGPRRGGVGCPRRRGGAGVVSVVDAVCGVICVGGEATDSPGTGRGLSAPAPTRLLESVPATSPATHNATAILVRLARCMVPGACAFMSPWSSLRGVVARTGDRPRYRRHVARP